MATTTKATKRQFRQVLNDLHGDSVDQRGGLTGARTQQYGDWLYRADRGMFDHLYARYLAGGVEDVERG